MRADEVRSIAASVAGSRVVVTPGDATGSWTAWFAGDETIARGLRTKLREIAPDVAIAVTWIGLPELPADDAIDGLVRLARRIGRPRPETALERIVAVAWQEALGVAVDSIDDDFFAIGGHSLLAADVAARLDDIVGIDVPLTMVFDYPTVREQAAWLATSHATGVPAVPRGPATFVEIVSSSIDSRALATVGARYGVTAPPVEIDLRPLQGSARRAAWHELGRELAREIGDEPWRAAVVRFPSKPLLAVAFDGRRFDAGSARRWIREVSAASEGAAWWPSHPLAPAVNLEVTPEVIAGWRAFRIGSRRGRALLDLGRQQGATASATLVAAIAVIVARRLRRDEVVLAIPAPLRAGELRDAFGALTTTTTIAISIADAPSFLGVIDRTQTAICRAWASAAGAMAGAPVQSPDASVDVAPAREPGEAIRRASGSTSLAFVIGAVPSGVVAGRIGFDDHDITADDADALAADLDTLIDAVTADPARPLARSHATPITAAAVDAPAFGEPLVLSHAQERLWFVERLTPGTTANHLQRVYRIEGLLDPDALARGIAAMMARHDALRTVFRTIDAQPRQLVAREMAIEHHVDDAEDELRVAALATTEYARTFSLETGPLWRTRLVRVANGDHRLILTVHHLIIDALSFLVWHREVAEHYQAEASRTTPRLAPLGTTVAAIASWERSPDGQKRIADDLAFWLDHLAGATPLELPLDYRRPPVHGLGRHECTQLVSPDRTAEMRALGRRQGTTLPVTLIAAAAAFLARHTQQEDLVCVVPASRRDDPGRKSMIGLLLNLLPLRVRLTGDPTFAEIVARTNRALREAMAHAEAPFERIVAGLGVPREPGRQPLFDVILNMIPGAERLWWGETRVTLEGITGSAQPCDLVIGANSRPGGFLGLTLRGRDDVFAPATLQRMAKRFETLLLAAVAAPHTRLSALPLVPDDERELVVETWNATAIPIPDTTVHGLFEARAAASPDAIAILQGDRSTSYRELDVAANRIAAAIASTTNVGRAAGPEGLRRSIGTPGRRIGVQLEPSPELAAAALGILKAGCVYVPFGVRPTEARVAQLSAEVDLVITPDFAGAEPAQRPSVSPDDAAYIVFTSGSTGRPKGVSTTHRAMVNQIAWFERDLPWRPGEVSCLRSSPAFVDAMWELFGPLAAGVPLVIATADEMLDPRLLIAALERHHVTRVVVVPSLLQAMLALGARCPALSLVLATSEELKPALVDQFYAARPESRLVNLYGASETADQVAGGEVRPRDRGPRTPIGKPIANTRIYVLDPAGQPMPIGVTGEIYASGAGVGHGYLPGARDDDQARFIDDPFAPGQRMYRTRDRGRWRHDGVLEYDGRLDHQLKIRGVRVDPAEVEAAILVHPNVGSVAVVGSTVEIDGETRLAAFVVPRPGTHIDARELRRFLRTSLPETL
ncbi:MAG TPA: condensation domain-containing protein, partial [Kofleriaceae bacterium]|nr:condensation domain-containing protein [Kofleriaceae bacterium]